MKKSIAFLALPLVILFNASVSFAVCTDWESTEQRARWDIPRGVTARLDQEQKWAFPKGWSTQYRYCYDVSDLPAEREKSDMAKEIEDLKSKLSGLQQDGKTMAENSDYYRQMNHDQAIAITKLRAENARLQSAQAVAQKSESTEVSQLRAELQRVKNLYNEANHRGVTTNPAKMRELIKQFRRIAGADCADPQLKATGVGADASGATALEISFYSAHPTEGIYNLEMQVQTQKGWTVVSCRL